MNTAARATALAHALKGFPGWRPVSAGDLVSLVASELGDPLALDPLAPAEGEPPPPRRSIAVPRSPILHIVSGNTPAAAIQSLSRGLLVGATNFVKLPSAAPAVADTVRRFVTALPDPLAGLVHIETQLPGAWLRSAAAINAFGSDETIQEIHARTAPHQTFHGHGHAVSFAIIYHDPEAASAPAAALDIAAFDQNGCLSPHDIYIAPAAGISYQGYAHALATALAHQTKTHPPDTPDDPRALAEVANLRSSYNFRAANDPEISVFASPDPSGYTVIAEPDPLFAVSPTFRTVFVKPLPGSLGPALRFVAPHLSTVAIHPLDHHLLHHTLSNVPTASRVCAVGDAQTPPVHWHQDGRPTLSHLVRWIDTA